MPPIFKNLRVIELANVLAGPSVGQFFAELGAEVIKIENPKTKGDVTRSWKLKSENSKSSISAYFSAANSGKKSIGLDIRKEEDLSILYKLIAKSDIVIASYKAGDAEKLKVDYQSLKSINPNIIYGQITGYGDEDERVGYDAIIQAESGFMSMNGEPGGNSLKMPVALVDVLAAHHLKEAILLAYINLLKSNEGSKVSVSLFESAIASLANQATNYLIAGHIPQKMGVEHPNIAPYGTVLKTADQKEILLAVGTNSQFQKLCEVMELPELSDDERFKTNTFRVENRKTLNQILLEKAKLFPSDMLIQNLKAAQIPAGKLQSVEEALQGKDAEKMILKSPETSSGLRNFAGHLSFMGKSSHLAPPPKFDQDRDEILALI
ncbi:CoA transferase [Marivirga tractuosa]|uniref:L-carnitine dehydratase/bile acid-inducible protein F n=1 Tax=Marivirga tractuosa (strain ATCC 23168 / DSM 4126 / NBRC 15989 / NCIMB 1408 / VKM B-1430 / H-43) TaxID=643867 RepID=E4TW40_MARTH|nr:CaiB/BaiF CoA-transferase family protein [Marivirga tractuosa]ADR23258.1 L-carnitine dehydratase/bile acid-inducible protein F [Marivirga tractuosa DSM 4126]BDD16068.1 CoA transferase [Marivirga tractuosa]